MPDHTPQPLPPPEGPSPDRPVPETDAWRPEGALSEDDLLGSLIQEALTQEALTQEALTQEALTQEALTQEALTQEALTQEALTQEAFQTQAFLAEVQAAESESASEDLRPAVRAAALQAFDGALNGAPEAFNEGVGTAPAHAGAERADTSRSLSGRSPSGRSPSGRILRARRPQPLLSTRTWLSAAAMLLVTLAASLLLSGSEPDAEAGIQLNALKRLDRAGAAGMSRVESRYFAPLGRVFTPVADEWLSFAFAPEALLVVGAGDAVRVTHSRLAREISVPGRWLGTGQDEEAGQTTLLRLESGEARLATRGGAIVVEVAEAGLFVLLEGAAHIAVALEGASGMPVVALAEGSEARFHRSDGSSIPLAGPSRVLLAPQGPRAFGTVARSLFRELAFFGGPLPEPTQERRVSARLWRARLWRARSLPVGSVQDSVESKNGADPKNGVDPKNGEAEQPSGSWIRRRRADLQLLTQRAGAAAAVSLKWRPQRILSDAHLMRVALRAPTGTTVSVPRAGLDGVTVSATVSASVEAQGRQATAEPGIATVEIPLPAGWHERLTDGELELVIEVPAAEQVSASPTVPTDGGPQGRNAKRSLGVVRAWFDGVSLVLGPSEHGLPCTPHAEKSSRGSPKSKSQN